MMQLSFFSLPRELRDTIHHHYVFEFDGYHFNFTSSKLQTSTNRPIDLALIYTCKQVATKMHDLALGANTIQFATIYSQIKRLKTKRFSALFKQMQFYKRKLLDLLSKTSILSCSQDRVVLEKVATKFPHLSILLLEFIGQGALYVDSFMSRAGLIYAETWGVADSDFRGFCDCIIQVLLRRTQYLETYLTAPEFYVSKPGDSMLGLQEYEDTSTEARLEGQANWCKQFACFLRSPFLVSGPE